MQEGDSVYFSVEADCYPPPQFKWKRVDSNGTIIEMSSENNGFQSNLTFSNVSMSDFGNYTVSAENEVDSSADEMFFLQAEGWAFPCDTTPFYLFVSYL